MTRKIRYSLLVLDYHINNTNISIITKLNLIMKNENFKLNFKWNILILLILAFVIKVEANTSINKNIVLQENSISGTVKDINGELLIGVNIIVEGTSIGTATDFDGKFTLNVNDKNKISLVASYQGFLTFKQEIDFSTNHNQVLNIILKEDAMSLEEVVITGNINPRKRIESSVASTTLDIKEMEQRVVRNNADLLKAVPGLWVESTGGDGPANVWVRGFPQEGGYGFLGVMEDGLPVFQGGYNSIPSPDQFYKTDINIKNVEVIRGGTSPIVMQGAAGAVMNVISKEGTDVLKGAAKLSYNPVQNTKRFDINIGGPLNNTIKYNIGGFYRVDDGIYNADHNMNKGGQIKGNIVKSFDKGFVKVYAKYINDKVNWNLPSPYIFNANGDLGEIPGFDLKKDGASIGKVDTKIKYTLPGGKEVDRDLKNGFDTNLSSFGFEYKQELGNNWTLNNKFRIDAITHNNDTDLSTGIASLDPNTPYFYTDGTQITDVVNLNGNGLSTGVVFFATDNEYDNIINRLELTKRADKNALTIGFEYFNYKQKSKSSLSLGTKEVKNNPRLLVPGAPGSGITPIALFAPSGVTRVHGDEDTYSFYISDELKVSDKFRIDMGFRLDSKSVTAVHASRVGSPIFLGGPGFSLGDDEDPIKDDGTGWAATIGLNYKLNEKTALFARGSRAYNGLKLGDYTVDGADIDKLKSLDDRLIYQGEVGLKYNSSNFTLFTSLLYAKVNNATSGIFIPGANLDGSPNGNLIQQQIFLSTRTISAEIEAQYKLNDNFIFKLISTLQKAEYTELNFVASPGTIVEGQEFDWSGNDAARVPKFTSDLTLSYNKKKINAFLSYRYYSDRWSTTANNVKLKGYSQVYIGAGYKISKKLRLNLNVANLFNTVALSAGNTRGDQFVDVDEIDNTPQLGRRILPFSVYTKLTYTFGK